MEQRFEPTPSVVTDEAELAELIDRLHRQTDNWTEPVATRTDHITVEDIAEALDLDPLEVAKVLKEIHEEHEYARVAGALREMEEPLYRVERPGHAEQDSLNNPVYRLRSVQILTERIAKPTVLHRRTETNKDSERLGNAIGKGVLILLVIVALCCAIYVVVGMTGRG